MQRSMAKQATQRGFTLIEIIAVLVLLAFILMILAPNIFNQMKKGQQKAVKIQIEAVKNALNAYYLDNATFPTTEQGLRALLEKPSIPPVPENWDGPYLEDKKVPVDPWNTQLRYQVPGVHNPDKYDLYSLGPDKAEGGADVNADIGNW